MSPPCRLLPASSSLPDTLTKYRKLLTYNMIIKRRPFLPPSAVVFLIFLRPGYVFCGPCFLPLCDFMKKFFFRQRALYQMFIVFLSERMKKIFCQFGKWLYLCIRFRQKTVVVENFSRNGSARTLKQMRR